MSSSLLDLYVRGIELEVGPPGNRQLVWLQKMNPIEHSKAIKKADAARARVLSCKFDTDCDEYQSILNEVLDLDREVRIEVLAAAEEARITPALEAKVAEEDKWKKDNYLQGLRDAWADGGAVDFALEPEDSELARIHDELKRFVDQVRGEIDYKIDSFRRTLASMTEKELINSAVENRLKVQGDFAWIEEYYKNEIAFGVRDPKNHSLTLLTRSEVDELQGDTYAEIQAGFQGLNVEPLEGKDSAGLPPSSDSSAQSAPEATAQSSGPPAV